MDCNKEAHGCDGGSTSTVYLFACKSSFHLLYLCIAKSLLQSIQYLHSAGFASDDSYPYEASQGECHYDPAMGVVSVQTARAVAVMKTIS